MRTLFLLFPFYISCTIAPNITYIDTPTQMEMDSVGLWDELEKSNDFQILEVGPTPYPEDTDNPRRKRILNVLKGEFVNE